MIKVTMIKTAAGPRYVLLAGKTYRLPTDEAEAFITAKAAVEARRDAIVTKIPATPDPGDTGESQTEVEEDE